jgi:hypothetical protein
MKITLQNGTVIEGTPEEVSTVIYGRNVRKVGKGHKTGPLPDKDWYAYERVARA